MSHILYAFIFAAVNMGLFIQIFTVGSKRRIFSAIECVSAYATSYYSVNLGPILHRFCDSATDWLKPENGKFSYSCLILRPRSVYSLWKFGWS